MKAKHYMTYQAWRRPLLMLTGSELLVCQVDVEGQTATTIAYSLKSKLTEYYTISLNLPGEGFRAKLKLFHPQ